MRRSGAEDCVLAPKRFAMMGYPVGGTEKRKIERPRPTDSLSRRPVAIGARTRMFVLGWRRSPSWYWWALDDERRRRERKEKKMKEWLDGWWSADFLAPTSKKIRYAYVSCKQFFRVWPCGTDTSPFSQHKDERCYCSALLGNKAVKSISQFLLSVLSGSITSTSFNSAAYS